MEARERPCDAAVTDAAGNVKPRVQTEMFASFFKATFSIPDSWEERRKLKRGTRGYSNGTAAWERGQLLLEDRGISIRKTVTPKGEVNLYFLSVDDAG